MRFVDPDGMWSDWSGLLQKAKNYIVNKTEQAIKNIGHTIVKQVKQEIIRSCKKH